jgi:hypothetical protein
MLPLCISRGEVPPMRTRASSSCRHCRSTGIYVQVNDFAPGRAETVAQFGLRLRQVIEELGPRNVVLDMGHNFCFCSSSGSRIRMLSDHVADARAHLLAECHVVTLEPRGQRIALLDQAQHPRGGIAAVVERHDQLAPSDALQQRDDLSMPARRQCHRQRLRNSLKSWT